MVLSKVKNRFVYSLLILITISLIPEPAYGQVVTKDGSKWYRGNTHTHARFSDDNDQNDVPEIAGWYAEAGYNFLCLSEHNDHLVKKKIFCHDEVPAEKNFIMLCGLELSNKRHHTALGINKYIGDESSLQDGVSKTILAGGVPILNHPMDPKIKAADFISTDGLKHLEVFNGGRPEETLASEQLWDSVLSAQGGRCVYAVASDDNHYNKANVGKGWIMVRSKQLNREEILENIITGNFYATTGIILNEYRVSKKSIGISAFGCDSISFIGEYGKVLKIVPGQKAKYRIRGNEKYVRAKLTDNSGKTAWTQPVFLNHEVGNWPGRIKQ